MKSNIHLPNRYSVRPFVEIPTVLLIVFSYAALGVLVYFHRLLPWWVLLLAGSTSASMHSSLQHEVLHGHPTRWRWLNESMIFVTPHFWVPYRRYRSTHLQHHIDVHLTDPDLDPESYYLLPAKWGTLTGPQRQLYQFNQTLCGRMLIGPAVSIARLWSSDWRAISRGNLMFLRHWLEFFISCGVAIFYINFICGMPVWKYCILFAYPAISLALVRSYCEHQAAEGIGARTIIVESSFFWSVLFLNNNLHSAHHARPSLAWYRLPKFYAQERTRLIARNQGYVLRGYSEMFRRYFFTPKEPIVYPDTRWIRATPSQRQHRTLEAAADSVEMREF